jgi:hypothetical protein
VTKHRWFFEEKRQRDHRSSASSLRVNNIANNDERTIIPRTRVGTSGDNRYDLYVDDEVMVRHFWVATAHVPRLELLQRTKFTTAHHLGGDPNRAQLAQMSANAAFY